MTIMVMYMAVPFISWLWDDFFTAILLWNFILKKEKNMGLRRVKYMLVVVCCGAHCSSKIYHSTGIILHWIGKKCSIMLGYTR